MYAYTVLICLADFWAWFPFSLTGFRACTLFVSGLIIVLLRIARLHVGWRTTSSPFETFLTFGLQLHNVWLPLVYGFSAWVFSEVYIWSVSDDADLAQTKSGPHGTRLMLNERQIYLRSFLYALAVLQAFWHFYDDYDRIEIPVTKTKPTASSDQRVHLVVPADVQLRANAVNFSLRAMRRSLVMSLAFPFIYSAHIPILPFFYSFQLRKTAWTFNRLVVSLYRDLPKSTMLPPTWPFHIRLVFRCSIVGFLLLLLWELSNAAISAYIAQEPLVNDRPISHRSKDPTGTLLAGLVAKKQQTRVRISHTLNVTWKSILKFLQGICILGTVVHFAEI